jgi:flagellar FliJ protein
MSRGFSLAGLLRLRKLEEDERAIALNSARDRESIGVARTRRIRNSLADSPVDPLSYVSLVSVAATRATTATMLAELGEADRAAAAEVEEARVAHADAHRRTKGLEKLETRFEEARTAEELRAEQLVLDDLSARAWHISNPAGRA